MPSRKKTITELSKYYTYTFKSSYEKSYSCISSRMYKGDTIILNNYIPLHFWFNNNYESALPFGYINGEYFDLRKSP